MNIEYIDNSSSANELLHYCTIIAKAFSEALDQNECNLKVPVSIAEEIKDLVKDAETIHDIINEETKSVITPDKVTNEVIAKDRLPVTSESILNNRAQASYLKKNCFSCDFNLPGLDLKDKLKWTMDRLKAVLDIYKKLFDAILDPNLCHAAYAFQYTCIPDIIKLIALLLTVYTSILALRKLGGISMNAFIKGLISGLMGQIIAHLNIQVDFSKTGLGCLINIFEELAAQIPDGENLSRHLSKEQMEELNIDPNSSFEYKKYAQQLSSQTQGHTRNVSRVFKDISDTVNKASVDFNENLENVFNIIDYLQCEAGRSGSNFIEVAEYMKKLVDIVNLLSSIAAMVAKKQIQAKLCTTPISLEDLNALPDKEDIYTPITDLEITEVIEEYIGKVVELTKDENDNVLPLIIDKDKEQILPKLNFYTCNLTDFIKAHTVENITEKVLEEIEREELIREVETGTYNPRDPSTWRATPEDLVGVDVDPFTVRKKNWELYPIEYVRPSFMDEDGTTGTLSESDKLGINNNRENSLQDILDIVYNNPLDRSKVKDPNKKSEPKEGIDPLSNKEKSRLRFTDPEKYTEQTSFDSSCRDISDVLDRINSMR